MKQVPTYVKHPLGVVKVNVLVRDNATQEEIQDLAQTTFEANFYGLITNTISG
jgi:hypothetical protein